MCFLMVTIASVMFMLAVFPVNILNKQLFKPRADSPLPVTHYSVTINNPIDIYPPGVYIKHMASETKHSVGHRTTSIEGQIKGLQEMIDTEAYCVDTLAQSLNIQKSLSLLDGQTLENHFRTHIIEKLKSRDDTVQDEAIKELLALYELSNIRRR